jgi:NTP pyrophosphatase (non-canonical NTP hydrolase)
MKKELQEYIKELSLRDEKTLSQKALKVSEETGELAKVILPFENASGTTHRFVEKERVLEESVDVILTAISIAYDLGFSHDDIEDMMLTKAQKWQKIQTKDAKVEYPIPYEIHITVDLSKLEYTEHGPYSKFNDETRILWFKDVCERIGVKPIIINLENGGESVMKDVMTSSHTIGDNSSSYIECSRISNELEKNGFTVVRKKIETVPWHPAAPSEVGDLMPKDCYFEAHVGCTIFEHEEAKLSRVVDDLDVHMSKNFFKKKDDGRLVKMITMRKYDGLYDDFIVELDKLKSRLSANNIEFEKVITEFSIYDTMINHDFIWINK